MTSFDARVRGSRTRPRCDPRRDDDPQFPPSPRGPRSDEIFAAVAKNLAAKGELLRGGTIVGCDADRGLAFDEERGERRDPEMSQSKKGNQWYFGMKVHVGVDAKSGLVHTAGVTTGKVHDAKVMV
jgi:IS5 family transposase